MYRWFLSVCCIKCVTKAVIGSQGGYCLAIISDGNKNLEFSEPTLPLVLMHTTLESYYRSSKNQEFYVTRRSKGDWLTHLFIWRNNFEKKNQAKHSVSKFVFSRKSEGIKFLSWHKKETSSSLMHPSFRRFLYAPSDPPIWKILWVRQVDRLGVETHKNLKGRYVLFSVKWKHRG